MTPTIFATIGVNGIVIRSAIPGEPYGTPLPFSAARLWELERQGQVWTSCWARWLWVRRSVADAGPVVEPLAALAGSPGAIVEDAPTAAATGGHTAVVVQADVEDQQVAIQGLGLIGVGADTLLPGAEGRGRSGHGRGGVIG